MQHHTLTPYMARITAENALCREHGFRHTTCSGINYLEGMLADFRRTANFVCTADTSQCTTFERGGGWYERRVYTVFILSRYTFGDADSYARAMQLCREVYRQFQTRFVRDREAADGSMLYLDVADIRSNELGGQFLNGCTGLYFMLTMERPVDLCFSPSEWTAQ